MSRRDYIRFAEMIRDAGYLTPDARGRLISDLSEILKADNPRFDSDRFRSACYTGAKLGEPEPLEFRKAPERKPEPVASYVVTTVYAGAFDGDQVFRSLERAQEYAEREAESFRQHAAESGEGWAVYVADHYCGGDDCGCAQYATDHHPYLSSADV